MNPTSTPVQHFPPFGARMEPDLELDRLLAVFLASSSAANNVLRLPAGEVLEAELAWAQLQRVLEEGLTPATAGRFKAKASEVYSMARLGVAVLRGRLATAQGTGNEALYLAKLADHIDNRLNTQPEGNPA